jgi:hypothetical protein
LIIPTIWLSLNFDFFTGISSENITRKFHFWSQLKSGGITGGLVLAAQTLEYPYNIAPG